MRSFFCTRFHRRFVVRYFGSLRNLLLWVIAVSLTVYVVDSFLFGSYTESLETLSDENANSAVKQMNQDVGEKRADVILGSQQPILPSGVHPSVVEGLPVQATGPVKSVCTEQPECPAGEYSYYIQSGYDRTGSPTICFNGHYVYSKEKKNGKRGMNMAVVNSKTMQVEDVREFDTYEDDSILLRYLRLGVEDGSVILVATQDEASASLKDDSKKWLRAFGSELIDKMQFRDSFVMLGQRGLTKPGTAIEKLSTRHQSQDFPDAVEIKGCLKLPLGELKPANLLLKVESQAADSGADKSGAASVVTGEKVENCGLPSPCDTDSVAVHLFSGKENTAGPRMCIGGAYVFDNNVNNPGRGINVAIYDVDTSTVVQTKRYDTYESLEDVAAFVKMLQGLTDSQLMIAVSHDDMYTALSDEAKQLLELTGSSYSKQLSFRDAWAFVGRSGIKGYSPVEEIEFGGPDVWPSPVDKRLCVPKKLPSHEKKEDVEKKKNAPKRVFCRKYDGYEDFCRGSRLDEHLTPVPLDDTAMVDNAIFKIPIIVIPGLSHIATLQQFEALLSIPGIDPKMVTVMFDMKFEESGLLADFFGYSKVQLSGSTKYIYLIEKALENIWNSSTDSNYIILIEEEVIPTVDFLNYFGQCLPILDQDETLIGATAWNENGFDAVSTIPNLVYRGHSFPGLGLLLKKSFYIEHMKGKMKDCCLRRSWYGWFEGNQQNQKLEVIIPDVSRVVRRQFMGLTENVDYVRAYFGRPRSVTTSGNIKLQNVEELVGEKYDAHIDKMIAKGTPLESAKNCLDGRTTPGDVIPNEKGQTFVIYYEQADAKDELLLSQFLRCFGLFYANGNPAKGLHQGVLRFTVKENHVFLVGSVTPFYAHKPSKFEAVNKSQMPKV